MGLNPKQSRNLLELVRDYDRLQAEITSLAAILRNCEDKMSSSGGMARQSERNAPKSRVPKHL